MTWLTRGIATLLIAVTGTATAVALRSSGRTADFQRFVADAQASTFYSKWSQQNPGELSRWTAYRDALLGGHAPPPPTMSTRYGASLVDGGVLYLDSATTVPAPPPTTATTTTPAPPPPPTTTTTTTPPPVTPGQNQPGIGAWRISGNDTLLGEQTLKLGRYSIVVMDDWQAAPGSSQFLSPAQIHADSPATKVLMYASGTGIDTTSTTLAAEQYETNAGVTAYDVNRLGRQDFYLRDSAGNILYNAGYPWMAIGDFGNPDYQKLWVSNVVARAKLLGFDGVSIDDIVGSFWAYMGNKASPKYPTQAAWQQALASFMGYIVPALQAQGLYVGAEVFGWDDAGGNADNDGSADAAWWSKVLAASHLNAIFCEYFEQNPNTFAQSFDNQHLDWTGNWDGWLKLVDVAQSYGADFWGLDYATGNAATDLRLETYAKASFLLKWNGSRFGAFFWQTGRSTQTGSIGNDPWDPNWTTDIGAPVGAMYPVGSAFRRDYTLGTVVVNPTLSTQTVPLGATYTTPSGAQVSSATLAPTSAAILTKTTTTAPASPPTTTTVASGPQQPSAPGSWTVTFDDEFNGLNTSAWQPRFWWNGDTFWPTQELQVYRQSSATVGGGSLALTAQRASGLTNFTGSSTDSSGEPFSWTSGFESTGGVRDVAPIGFAQRYGYFEARIKMPPAAAGLWPAFWLEGVNGSNGQLASSYNDGSEIDAMELIGADPNDLQMHLHGAAEYGASYRPGVALMGGDWHSYAVDWEPGFVAWYFDGQRVAQYSGGGFDNQPPHYVMLNLAVGGANSWPGAPNGGTPSPASMLVDYVRAWRH